MSYIAILGRQPAIGHAELESRFGADALQTIQPDIVQIETVADLRIFDQIGSTLKVAKLLTPLPFTEWRKIESHLVKTLPQHLQYIPEGKITIGLSVHGLNAPPNQINATALTLKKVIKKVGRSARVVPNNDQTLNTAQVIHNKLTGPNGIELLIIKNGSGVLLAQTCWVQDIEGYRLRDQERPARDARVGMLPPKLAQIIINLGVGKWEMGNSENPSPTSHLLPPTILDPFCGTGVILQEATLMGLNAIGTDLEPRMMEYSQKNIAWLKSRIAIQSKVTLDLAADATSHHWKEQFDVIACETYLGRPLSSQPNQDTLNKIIQDCNTIHKKFLLNIARQVSPGFRMCIAIPAWKTKNGFKHLPTLDSLSDLGYTRMSFVHAGDADLIYHRPDQIVARELVVLTRN